jgi:hypothetical protein
MMKNKKLMIVLVLFNMLFLFLVGCNKPKHVGQWVDSSLREAIVFNNNGTFDTLYYYHPDPVPQFGQPVPQIPDDKTWKVRDRGTYAIDYAKNPAWLDLTVTEQGTQHRLEGLIKFLDDNTFYVGFGSGHDRPLSIDNASSRARFTRAAPSEITPLPNGTFSIRLPDWAY